MKKLKSLFLFLFILSPLPMLCGCEPGTIVSESEIAAINNGQYEFKYGNVDSAYETYLLVNKNKERDTYYQVGPTVFKCPYDFKIIVKSRFTDASYYLREAYNDGRYYTNQIIYLSFIHRQYMKSLTGKTDSSFNEWYDSNNQRMERSNYSDIDYSCIGKSYYGSYFKVTLKYEESIKLKYYWRDDYCFSNIENTSFGGGGFAVDSETSYYSQKALEADRTNNYSLSWIDFNRNITKDYRVHLTLYLDKEADVSTAKKVAKKIKSLYIVYDVTLDSYPASWSIDI